MLELHGSEGKVARVGETLAAPAGAAITVRAVLQAPAWMPLGTLEIVRKGVVVQSTPAEALPVVAGRRTVEITTTLAGDTAGPAWWVAVLRPGAAPSHPAQSKPVWAVTNPVYSAPF